MEEKIKRITKQYLETLSFEQLIVLADECGIDVPADLSRAFLISDLLDVAAEDEDESMIALPQEVTAGEGQDATSEGAVITYQGEEQKDKKKDRISADDNAPSAAMQTQIPDAQKISHGPLEDEKDWDGANTKEGKKETEDDEAKNNQSGTCTPTDVALVASGPLWALVYWNVGGREALGEPRVFLRINSFDDKDEVETSEKAVLDVEGLENEHFILLPRTHKYVQIDLLTSDYQEDAVSTPPLTSSAIFELPMPSSLLLSNASEPTLIQTLSGIEPLIQSHYNSYRNSLSPNLLQFTAADKDDSGEGGGRAGEERMRQVVFLINSRVEYLSRSDAEKYPEQAARFFMTISELYLPLLNMFARLTRDNIPFKVSLVLPSAALTMLDDIVMQSKFVEHLEQRIKFGECCLPLCAAEEKDALQRQIDIVKEKKRCFEQEYARRLLNAFGTYRERGNLEILATCGTPIFLPHYIDIEETLCAQIETGLYAYKTFFADKAEGFFLPEMGYQSGLEKILSSYGVRYTILDARGVLFSKDTAPCGIFSPVLCDAPYKSSPLALFARDNRIDDELFGHNGYAKGAHYCNVQKDIAFTVQKECIPPFIPQGLPRSASLYRCWDNHGEVYNEQSARDSTLHDAASFIRRRIDLFDKVETVVPQKPLSLTCVIDADDLIDKWTEGLTWLENVYRGSINKNLAFATPKEVLAANKNMATIRPYFSADLGEGYAETLNCGNNCWMLPLVRRASKRMTSLADRFSDGSTIKARLLNVGAKELMLAQSSTWQKRINIDTSDSYALGQFWSSIKSFTTVFDDLGSNTFSPSWLTTLEGEHQIFPWINYKIFCKKR